MGRVVFRAGHCYHLNNRGVNRQPIFFEKENWAFFLGRLRFYCRADLVDILAYCLTPTHYHLLVHLQSDDLGHKIRQSLGVVQQIEARGTASPRGWPERPG